MEKELTEALGKWLEAVTPLVAETLTEILTPENLSEMGNEEGVHGPLVINMEQFRAPITGVNFYVMVVEDTMMLATTIRTKEEESLGDICFDMVFSTSAFPEDIKKEENVKTIKDRILELYKQNYE